MGDGASDCNRHPLLWSNKPPQKVMHPPLKLTSSLCIRGWCSLVYRHLSCMGQVTSPTPCKPTSMGGETKMTPQENNGSTVTQWPTSETSLGLIKRKLWLLPWMSAGAPHWGWVKTLGNVMWQWTSEGTHMCVRGSDVNAHWCQEIVNPKIDTATHWTGSLLARPNKEGGVKWVCTPPCQEEGWAWLPPWHGILPPTQRGTLATHWGVASYPPSKTTKNWIQQRNQNWQPEHKDVLTKRWGWLDKPWGITQVIGLNSPQIIIPTKLWTVIDSIVIY